MSLFKKNLRKANSSGENKCEICGEKTFLQQHHIEGRQISNPHSKNNLCSICSNCHLKIHYGKIIIEGRFLTSNGYKLIFHLNNENSLTGKDKIPHLI